MADNDVDCAWPGCSNPIVGTYKGVPYCSSHLSRAKKMAAEQSLDE